MIFLINFVSFLLALFIATTNRAETQTLTARQQITKISEKQITNFLEKQANIHHWPSLKKELHVVIPSKVDNYPPCSTTPNVKLSNNQTELAHHRLIISCRGDEQWQVAVLVKSSIFVPVAIAKNALQRGQIITEDNIALQESDIAAIRSSVITNIDDITGMMTKRRMREGELITRQKVLSPILVQRGAPIIIIASQHGVEARTSGVALKKGSKGEIIKVKNSSSGREMEAIVIRPGEVKIINENYL